MVLHTSRLILRPWTEADAAALFELARHPDVGPAAGWPVHSSVENSREIIRNVLSEAETYAVCCSQDGSVIGSIGLMTGEKSNLNLAEDEGEIGYWLGVPYWGQGLMPEAVRELIRHAFTELSLETLYCGYFDGNDKSRRCQEKCGFQYLRTKNDVPLIQMPGSRTEHITRLRRPDWKNTFVIRRLDDSEIPSALLLSRQVFSQYEAPDYSAEGCEEFRRSLSDRKYLEGIRYYGAFDGKTLIGVLGYREEPLHICLFFVDGRYHRLGIGKKLLHALILDHPGSTVSVNSSPFALPFYRSAGFAPAGEEQKVRGLRFTPMVLSIPEPGCTLLPLSDRKELKDRAAAWFSSKWRVPEEAYRESMEESFSAPVPSWYLALKEDEIVGGLGVIENDFHPRKDLRPNVCAVYTEPECRSQGIAGRLLSFACDDMHKKGIDTLYLLTDHIGFYERYGWEFLCPVTGDGEEQPSRMYVHHSPASGGTVAQASEA